MPDLKTEKWAKRYESLSMVGRAVFLAETGVRAASSLIDKAVHQAADVVAHAEKAFKQGLDPNIEDAKILEERNER